MSDELVAEPGINLEDDNPAALVPVPEPAPLVAEPVVDQDAELAADPGRMVPASALIAERKQRQALTERASRADVLEQQLAEARPYLDLIRNNPGLFQPRDAPAPVASPASDVPDPDALEAAQLLDFWIDGRPDVAKARQYLDLSDRRAARLADAQIAPMRQQRMDEQATTNLALASQVKDASGNAPSQESIRAVWGALSNDKEGRALLADQRVAGVLAALALGFDALQPKKGGPRVAAPTTEPLQTEASGGAPRTRPTLSKLEESVAKERGIAPTKWAERVATFQPGRPFTLED